MKRILFMVALLVLSACAPAAPTVDPAQIQASAIAAASTMIAMTQAAIPTPTPTLPPSPTPLPSPTFQPLPTLDLIASPTIASSSSADICSGDPPLAAQPDGKKTTVKITNENKAPITLSLWLYKTVFGECGWISYSLGGHQSTTATLPQGCYYGAALVNDPQKPSKAFGDNMCMDNNDTWTMLVGSEVVRLAAP